MSKTLMAAALSAAMVAGGAIPPASAAPVGFDPAVARPGDAQLDRIQYRGCYRGESRSACRDRLRWEQRTHRRLVWRDGRYYHDNNDAGAAIVGGILGFALGAAIAGSQQDHDYYVRHRYDRSWRRRCSSLPSFDWRSGTYMGRDGYRHYCVR